MNAEALDHRESFFLELYVPNGVAERHQIIGSGCPPTLVPPATPEGDTLCDLIVIAPTDSECGVQGWLAEAVRQAAKNLNADGVVYVLVPRHWRLKIARLLDSHSLPIGRFMLHHPNVSSSRYIVPLRGGPLGYVFSALVQTRDWRRQLARLILRFQGGAKVLATLLPDVALVARRSGAHPLAEWLFSSSTLKNDGDLVISPSWRGKYGPLVVYRFSDAAQSPDAIVKLSPYPAGQARSFFEAENLARFGPEAYRAGVNVPSMLKVQRVGRWLGIFGSAVNGKLLSASLAEQPARLQSFMEKLLVWLARWNCSTRVVKPLEHQDVERVILEPARSIAPLLEQGEAYLDWLAEYCTRVVNLPHSFVAAHNDLTMANILEGPKGELGIVDWEAASQMALPLTDLYYAMVDAVMTTHGDSDRFGAFRSCFEAGATRTGQMRQFEQGLIRALDLPPHSATLCLHACWLQHAANEQQRIANDDQRPFLEIVQWLAFHRTPIAAPIPMNHGAHEVSFATVSLGPSPR